MAWTTTARLHFPFQQIISNRKKHRNSQQASVKASLSVSSRTSGRISPPRPLKLEISPLFQKINGLCENGQLSQALDLVQDSFNESNPACSREAISVLLQACGRSRDLDIGRKIHVLVSSSSSLARDVILNTRLITMYSMCGSPLDARLVFEGLQGRNLFQWNALISGYTRNELWNEAVSVFCGLLSSEAGFMLDNFTLPCVMKACGGLLAVEAGRTVHGIAVKLGLPLDVYVNNALISMYGKCGLVDEATRVFDTMPERNLVSWNTLICAFSENGYSEDCFDVLGELIGEGLVPDDATLVTILPVCAIEGRFEMGSVVHGLAVKLSLNQELRVNNALIDTYTKCGYLSEAQLLFEKSLQRNVVCWNTMISGYARNGDVITTFGLLRRMQMDGIKANAVTILNVLPACLNPSELQGLKELHSYAFRNDFHSDDLVANALIAAYAKCSSPSYADRVFHRFSNKTVSSRNAIIGGYAQNGDPKKAIDMFLEMSLSGLDPDWFSIGSLLLACARLKLLRHGKAVHGFIVRNGLAMDSFIDISLLSLYIQCGRTSSAREVFDRMVDRNLVSWNAMMSGYSQNGWPNEALELFREMQRLGFKPPEIATMSALTSCAQLSALRLGKEAHCFALKMGLSNDTFVCSSIIDMYAKCGCIEQSRAFFNGLKVRDAVTWTVMIAGYGIHGRGSEALELLEKMRLEKGLKPDEFTSIGVLMACSHSGLVEEGLKYFNDMQTLHEIKPKLEHYACVADMLGRAGRLGEALRLIEEMPETPDGRIWASLLGACRIHGDLSLGRRVADKLLELEPDKAEHYVLASNLYAGARMWDNVRQLRGRMRDIGLVKDPGRSWTDVGGTVYTFVAGDYARPEAEEARLMWRELEGRISGIGYVADTGCVLHELEEEEEKVEVLRGHSEKLAIAFGLMRVGGRATIRVCKNLRMCGDCHGAAKLVSKVVEREIVVRDNKRFHHFKDGLCSCGDYW